MVQKQKKGEEFLLTLLESLQAQTGPAKRPDCKGALVQQL